MCEVKLSFESRTTPRSQMEFTLSNLWPDYSYWKCLMKRVLVKLMLSMFPSWAASSCWCTTGKNQSCSACAFAESLMNKIKSKGSKWLPWGTDLTENLLDWEPLAFTHCSCRSNKTLSKQKSCRRVPT
jgi:hypothetical protein